MSRLDGLARSIAERKAQKKLRAESAEVRFSILPPLTISPYLTSFDNRTSLLTFSL